MPGGNGTGPGGFGPMTGRNAGFCAGYSVPGFANRMGGGYNRRKGGFGRGRGFKHRNNAAGVYRQEEFINPYVSNTLQDVAAYPDVEILKKQAKYMQDNLNALNERIQKLEKLEVGREQSEK